MRKFLMSLAAVAGCLTLSIMGQAQQIYGDYIETRSADVYTGPCFANGEVGLVGDEAIMAWRVEKGAWDGVSLDGLSVVAAVRANATLGDPYSNPLPARSVLIVDERASAKQRAALMSFAKEQAGQLLQTVLRVVAAPITIKVNQQGKDHGKGVLRAGKLAAVETRPMAERDHICGNEYTYYPPLTETSHSMPAVAELDSYSGPSLGVSWTSRGKRSAFVGTFSQ